MILVGDIGGTHTRMAFLSEKDGHLVLESERVYPSQEHASLNEIVAHFMSGQSVRPDAACFGIAGPVLNGRAKVSNLGWVVDALQISRESSISPV
jgi:glucokinase